MQQNSRHTGLHALMLVVVGMMMFSLLGCGGKVPKKYIQPSEMEDILYDYHMLQSIRNVCDIDSEMSRKYLQTMFDKYGITQADFDSSMVYYLRHTDMLHDMYGHLSERIENEATAQGADAGGIDYGGGDTTNIWRLEKAHVFNTFAPYNVMQFSIPVDTAFKAGDRLILSFKTDFLYESGQRSGTAMLAVTLKNDSVITRNVILSGMSLQQMEISDVDRIGIKSIQGLFLQKESSLPSDRNSTSVRMMIVSDIKLIRMHTTEVKNEVGEKKDSTGVARPDTVNPRPGVSPPPTAKPKTYGPGDTSTPLPAGAPNPSRPVSAITPSAGGQVPPSAGGPVRGNAPNIPKPAKPAAVVKQK